MSHNPFGNHYHVGGRPWTKEEEERLMALVSEGHGYAKVAKTIGRTMIAAKSRAKELRRDQQERDRILQAKRDRRLRAAGAVATSPTYRAPDVPDHVWADRNRRLMAPRSLTAIICGDPEEGRRRV